MNLTIEPIERAVALVAIAREYYYLVRRAVAAVDRVRTLTGEQKRRLVTATLTAAVAELEEQVAELGGIKPPVIAAERLAHAPALPE